ncbi:Oxysterol-binding protein-domain-containing protein [Gamsiella multidivaricata]|uniref:Oxysterol-binding protein-domain-containing protein n=1 Tax=Gamsiella multidivaricata TaxID=101098 RepID=UPI0022211DF8|nr:Oxysterol-binding protein-domain-containing protein [Gamsiella multidivaricata]KAG0370600.1 hypothetical protein BGZ54_005505 [Gamsiella multidivaricata]KAI7832214.1 Oxysterol-binding protein-domain-containing protein [Gamsiella multidivaricata]
MSTVPSILRPPQKNRSEQVLAQGVRQHIATSSSAFAPSNDDPMKMFKILEALQKGDLNSLSTLLPTYKTGPVFPIPSTPGGSISSTHSFEGAFQGNQTTPVHLAVQCAQYPVIEYVINNTPQVDLNARDTHGSTALHIASSMGRLDVVKLLLSKSSVNDGILDHKGKSAVDVSATAEVRVVLKAHRTEYLTKTTALMHQYAEAGDLTSLISLFDHPRAAFVLNISHQDTETGSTILHSATKRKDMAMVQWCLDQGIDTLLRDKKGKTAADVSKDTKIKSLLRESRSQGTGAPLIPTTPGQPPRLEGTLFKWTNYASGYKARWFVLEDGILSYFHNQEDAGNACRGSINLRIAKVWIDSNDKQRFDIIGKGSIRYHLKAGHANEAKRWILALTQSKQWIEETSGNNRHSLMESRQSINLSSADFARQKGADSTLSRGRSIIKDGTSSSIARSQRSRSSSTSPEDNQLDASVVPHLESFVTMNNYVQSQIQIQSEFAENLVRLQRAAEVPEDSEVMKLTHAAHESSLALKSSIQKLQEMVQDREAYWKRILEQESQKRELWEESLRVLSEEQLEMQRVLKRTEESNQKMKKNRSVRSKASTPTLQANVTFGASTLASDGVTQNAGAAVQDSTHGTSKTISGGDRQVEIEDDEDSGSDVESGDEFFDAVDDDDIVEFENDDAEEELTTGAGATSHTAEEGATEAAPAAAVAAAPAPSAAHAHEATYIAPSFKGYPEKVRDRLPTKQTSLRPDVSLWAILKNSIGKDLSKITLPVYFNEPTSMLQRMAEDAEYIELLDKAVRQRGATERILFIAAFAMSNYSSTIGRVAKPFNPLLGETYEYCREDKQFRYISEQVSHHPPISACYCDSPNYNFYAEVDVKSKFWGKSFEVMPKGTSHVELKVPKAFAEGQQELLDDPEDETKFIEHYSWKKVTTCVQNLIVGTPWIDNYGDMIITNHRTGETCQLTFKARGWRGKDAYEIRGFAADARGKEVWEVAGRWNERLVARRTGKGNGEDLGSDAVAAGAVHVAEDEQGGLARSASPMSVGKPKAGHAGYLSPKHVLLLWKRDPVPSTPTPFNFTPFAMTLNDCPEELKKHLCPTDSRLRPDQRAMENAEFDIANTEKQRLEEKQRAKRKLLPPGKDHQPRWFKRNAQDDGWDFVGRDPPGQPKGSGQERDGRFGYWAERQRCGATPERPQQLKWDVEDDDIF